MAQKGDEDRSSGSKEGEICNEGGSTESSLSENCATQIGKYKYILLYFILCCGI